MPLTTLCRSSFRSLALHSCQTEGAQCWKTWGNGKSCSDLIAAARLAVRRLPVSCLGKTSCAERGAPAFSPGVNFALEICHDNCTAKEVRCFYVHFFPWLCLSSFSSLHPFSNKRPTTTKLYLLGRTLGCLSSGLLLVQYESGDLGLAAAEQ